MSAPKRIEVTLLGQTLAIRTEESPEYFQALARYVESRVASLKKSGVTDQTRALLLAVLDITDELFHQREDGQRLERDLDERLGSLLALLERAIPKESAR